MTTLVVAFDDERLSSAGCVFPREITDDPWIAFHGTSGVYEADIAREGLRYRGSVYSRAEVHALLSVFRDMNWAGRDSGGFAVLASFTLNDFASRDSKPIFLGEFSVRSALYAKADWAGGETARAIRHALADLDEFLRDPTFRQNHLDIQRKQCVELVQQDGLPSPVIQVDPEWLQGRLLSLEELRRRAEQPYRRHPFGLVYAVRFDEESAATVEHDGAAGYWTHMPIPPPNIVAAIRMSDDQGARSLEHLSDGRWFEYQFARRCRANGPGLLATVERRRQAPQPTVDDAPPVRVRHVRDPLVGNDEALAVVAEYGTDAVRAALQAQPHLRNDYLS